MLWTGQVNKVFSPGIFMKGGCSPYRGGCLLSIAKEVSTAFLLVYGFLAVMLFTQQVFHLECYYYFEIKSQPDVAYKSVCYKRAFNVIFQSSKN